MLRLFKSQSPFAISTFSLCQRAQSFFPLALFTISSTQKTLSPTTHEPDSKRKDLQTILSSFQTAEHPISVANLDIEPLVQLAERLDASEVQALQHEIAPLLDGSSQVLEAIFKVVSFSEIYGYEFLVGVSKEQLRSSIGALLSRPDASPLFPSSSISQATPPTTLFEEGAPLYRKMSCAFKRFYDFSPESSRPFLASLGLSLFHSFVLNCAHHLTNSDYCYMYFMLSNFQRQVPNVNYVSHCFQLLQAQRDAGLQPNPPSLGLALRVCREAKDSISATVIFDELSTLSKPSEFILSEMAQAAICFRDLHMASVVQQIAKTVPSIVSGRLASAITIMVLRVGAQSSTKLFKFFQAAHAQTPHICTSPVFCAALRCQTELKYVQFIFQLFCADVRAGILPAADAEGIQVYHAVFVALRRISHISKGKSQAIIAFASVVRRFMYEFKVPLDFSIYRRLFVLYDTLGCTSEVMLLQDELTLRSYGGGT